MADIAENLADLLIRVDELGRYYYRITKDTEELNLVLEPLDLFLDTTQSLLGNSHHPWAYELTRVALEKKLRLMNEMY